MRSEMVFRAEEMIDNKYRLCQAASRASRRLNQTFVTDVSWRNLIGESSGEAFSLRFEGDGIVYIQPEER